MIHLRMPRLLHQEVQDQRRLVVMSWLRFLPFPETILLKIKTRFFYLAPKVNDDRGWQKAIFIIYSTGHQNSVTKYCASMSWVRSDWAVIKIYIVLQLDIQPLHYRLSSIKGVRFRFANFASHFIRVQIFQIDFSLILSTSKYFR